MRIRRNAWKILGTASSISWRPPVVTEPAHAGYSCELNRSPWDVFVLPSPPPTPPPPADEPQEIEEGDEMRGEEAICMVNIAKIKKEAKGKKIIMKKDIEYIESSTVALSTSFSSNIAPMQEEEVLLGRLEPNGMQEHNNKSRPAKFQKWKGKSTIMEKEIDYVESNGPFTCKKTDGKQWQCKRPAEQPNSFCNHHIVQHRSYNKKAKAPTAVKLSICNQTERKTAKTPGVVDVSSYPASVPWRGTPQAMAMEATTEQSKTEHILECDISNVKATAEQSKIEDILECDINNVEATTEQSKTEEILECDISNVTHQEDILETSEEEEKPKKKNVNPVSRRRKRRRKLVKVRSLESLM